MAQTRLVLKVPRGAAVRLFAALEAAFEDDGIPLALPEGEEAAPEQEISLYIEDDPEPIEARAEAVLQALGMAATIGSEVLPDVDWVARSLEGLAPVRAGRFLVHGSHDRHRRRIGDIAIEIEAGLAFGTGHHATTAGCLEMIGRILKTARPLNVLDLGTGSAVLAIAVAKAARTRVLATDIDPVATAVAAANARLNGVSAFIDARTAAGLQHPAFGQRRPFDLIVANILARPLMQLAPAMAPLLARRGSLVLSGILERQRDSVLAGYVAQRFSHVATLRREGWVTLHLRR